MNNKVNYTRKQYLNKKRRNKEIKRKILLLAFSILFILILSFSAFGMKANAASKDINHNYKYYKSITVKTNDSLWDYAYEYAKDNDYKAYIKEVKNINNLTNNEIKQGMRLVLPYYSNELMFNN